MQTITTYVPVNGGTTPITLSLQTGVTEVINDSNYALIIQTNTGQCFLPPNFAQIYPTPSQGGTFNIQAIQSTLSGPAPTSVFMDNYYNVDVGPVNLITVNQYLPGELIGTHYPLFMPRELAPAPASQVTATGVSTTNLGLALTTGGLGNKVNGQPLTPYYTGLDIIMDAEGTQHSYTVTVAGLYSDGVTFLGSIQFVGHSTATTNGGQFYQHRPPQPIQGMDSLTPITATLAPVSGGTARISMILYVIGK